MHWNSHRSFHLIRDANDDDALSGSANSWHLGALSHLTKRVPSPPGSSSGSSSSGGDSSSSGGDSSSSGSSSSGSSSSGSDSSSGDSSSSSSSTGSDGSGGTACSGDSCRNGHNINVTTLAVVCGVVIPFTVAIALLVFFHFKNRKRAKREEALDKHGSLDFGLGEVPRAKRFPKKGRFGGAAAPPEMAVADLNPEKMLRGRGISADLGSPYLVAGAITESRTSFNSLSRDVRDPDDPYGPVKLMSERSRSPHPPTADQMSVKTTSTTRKPLLRRDSTDKSPPYASTANTRSNSPSPDLEKQPSLSRKPVSANGNDNEKEVIPPPPPPPPASDEKEVAARPTSNFSFPRKAPVERESNPPPMPKRSSSKGTRMNSIDGQINQPDEGLEVYATYANGLGIVDGSRESSPPPANGAGAAGLSTIHEPPPRNASLAPPQGAPDGRRLSTGIRPLPNLNPEDNAEQRANRIRSFYKEYFTEGAEGEGEEDYYGAYGHGDNYDGSYGDYYDYGQEYLSEAPIWDPNTGEFVMAGSGYDNPVTRRAMTPPPRGPPRFRGQPGHHYTSSSGHSAYGRTRAYSSASGRHPGPRGRAPKKRLPPPKPLQTLPTQHLLGKEDSSMTLLDFAPPPSMRDIVAGRPASPRSQSRPYSPSVRAFSPVIGTHNSLTVMPSPHLLRKSSTFTGLDFAPPPRFGPHAGEGGSDVASIRSGRSGKPGTITPMAEHNVRAGAYRLSRLPKETVGTRDDLAATLKPQWDMGR